MTNIASGDQEFFNSLIGNAIERVNAKFIMFHKTYSGLGLLISKAHVGSYLAIDSKQWQYFNPKTRFEISFLKINLYWFE